MQWSLVTYNILVSVAVYTKGGIYSAVQCFSVVLKATYMHVVLILYRLEQPVGLMESQLRPYCTCCTQYRR